MACLFALFAGIFPRLGLFIIWVARPARVDAAFDSWIWPLLGLIFLPFATLIYVVLWTAGGRCPRTVRTNRPWWSSRRFRPDSLVGPRKGFTLNG